MELLLSYRYFEEALPFAVSRAKRDALAFEPFNMAVFEGEVSAFRSASRSAVCGSVDFLSLEIGGPTEAWIVNVGGFRAESLQAIDENGSAAVGTVELGAKKPFGSTLGVAGNIGITRSTAGEVKIAHQLNTTIGRNHASFSCAMPDVSRAVEHVIGRPLCFGGRAAIADEIIVPKIAHCGIDPADALACAVVREMIVVVEGVHVDSQAPLFAVADAKSFVGFGFSFGKGRQKHRSQDGDDGHNDKQLDEREGLKKGPRRSFNIFHGSPQNLHWKARICQCFGNGCREWLVWP
jgi:hypothetical protein